MTTRSRLIAASLASAAAVLLGVLAAWPIYRDPWLLVPAAVALAAGVGVAALAARRRWPGPAAALALFVVFALTVVPVAVPQSLRPFPLAPLRGIADGVAAVVLGWKQLLTLTLPVGTYQTMLVPAYLVLLLTVFLTTWIALRAGRFAPFAAFPLLAPVAFGTVFGSSAVSAPLHLGPFTISAPHELALWAGAALLGAVWVVATAGAGRRAALRLGRAESATASRGRAVRVLVGVVTLAIAVAVSLALAPALDRGARAVPRDRIDPELVIREQASPLAGYRAYKRDALFEEELFAVDAGAEPPGRLRLAVLDAYDGVDFHVGADEAGRFARFPSGDRVERPTQVAVRVGPGYSGIWAPTAELGSVPVFDGSRAAELADAFYVNRRTGAAIAVPGGRESIGLQEGDGYRAIMSAAPDPDSLGAPLAEPGVGDADLDAGFDGGFDTEAMPELSAWVAAQQQPATGEGFAELVRRLRERGYLSHALSDGEGERLWIERLSAAYGTRFEQSAGGHSAARLEQLFAQLNSQERQVGEEAPVEQLVAGVGDDEQFAAAAALVARSLGFESRVVLGVRLGGEGAGVPGVPACSDVCTGEHLAAWIEVRDASGWVPFDVSPQVEQPPQAIEKGEQLPEFPTTPEERDANEVDPPLGTGEQSDDADPAEEPPAASWIWPVLRIAGLSVAALALLALPLLFLPFAKRWRRHRRRAEADPELRALGAWQEMLDRAADAGVRVPRAAGRPEVAAVLGTAPARWAAERADRAVFSPSGIGDEEADWMWAAADADRAEREAGFGRMRRIRAAYALSSYGVMFAARRRSTEESAAELPDRTEER